jgi:hypothetical protein
MGLHERKELLARQLLAEHDFTLGCRAMQLKDRLAKSTPMIDTSFIANSS